MAAPGKYTPSFSFSGYQATQPDRPLPGPRHDTEYFNIAYSLGQTIDALNDIRRDDGKLENGIVDWESLAPGLGDSIYPDAPQDGLLYGRTNATWAPVTIVHVGDNPPGGLRPGDLFWESDAGGLFINYFDGDSTQLVEIAGPAMNAAADAAAARAEAAAEAAENAASQAEGAISDAVSASNVPIFSTVQALLAYSVNPDLTAIRVNGYEAVGDGGAAFYVKKGTAPAHSGKFQSGDGAWWELDEDYVKPEMVGAEGNGAADDTAALVAASSAAVGIKAELLFTGKYYVTANTAITPLVRFSEHGGLKAASGIEVLLNGGFEAPLKAHIFDISAGGFIWPTKASTLTQYHYGAVNNSYASGVAVINVDSTAALQAFIDANVYFMHSDRIRFIDGVHRTTKPLLVSYTKTLRNINLIGAGTKYNYTAPDTYIGTSIISDHWECALEIQGARKMVIEGMSFHGPFVKYMQDTFIGRVGEVTIDPHNIEQWIPDASRVPTNPNFPNAGPTAPKGVLGRMRMCTGIHVDPRSSWIGVEGGKPSAVVKTAVRVVARSGNLATEFDNGKTVDGVVLATGDRFLYAATTDPFGNSGHFNNGVWVVQATGAAVRAADMDTSTEFTRASVPVTAGTYAGTNWWCNARDPGLNGIFPIIFYEYDGKVCYDDYAYPSWAGTIEQYKMPMSTDVTVYKCFIQGFGAAFAIQGAPADGNGDMMRMIECMASYNVYVYTWGNSQNRSPVARDCNFNFCKTMFSTTAIGQQNGKASISVDTCHMSFSMDLLEMWNGNVNGGVVLTNCYSEGLNRIGTLFSATPSAAAFTINGGMFQFGHEAWGRKPGWIINAGTSGVSILGGTGFMNMSVPLIIGADPRNCTIEAMVHGSLWMTGTYLPVSIGIPEAIMRHSTMDVVFLDPNQGPWQGKGFSDHMYSVTTGGGRTIKYYSAHGCSSVAAPIPFCSRTAGGDSNRSSYGIPVSLGNSTYRRTVGDGILLTGTQVLDVLTITLNAAPSAGDAMQRGLVKGSIVYNANANNLYVITDLVGAVITARQFNNIDLATNTTTSPFLPGHSISFTPTGHYTPNSSLELTYTSGSPNMTFQRGDGATSDFAQLPVGAARVASVVNDAMSPVTQAGSMITASAAGAITFSANARLTKFERAELFYVPRP